MPYRNPHLKNSLLPTLDQIRKYVAEANNDNPKFRDVRKLMSFLQRLPQADQRFMGLIQTRKLAVLGFPYRIKFPEDVPVNEAEKKKLAEIRERFRASKIRKAQATLMNGIIFGMAAARLTWDWHPVYKNYVKAITHLDLTDLDYNLEDSMLLDEIETNSTTNAATRKPLDTDIHLFIRHNPLEGIANDFPGSIARTNMIYVLLKYWDKFNWAQANEKFSDALIVALYDGKAKNEDIEKVKTGLQELGTDGKAAFSNDIEIKFLEAVRNGIADMHEKFINDVDKNMSISVLGQDLTTASQKAGSFAQAKVQNYVREDYLFADILELDSVMTDQYLKKDYQLNYGEPRDAYPVYETVVEEAVDYESNARIISELKATKIPLKQDEVYEKTGFTKPEVNDEVF
jgi:phage gp29-like protein